MDSEAEPVELVELAEPEESVEPVGPDELAEPEVRAAAE